MHACGRATAARGGPATAASFTFDSAGHVRRRPARRAVPVIEGSRTYFVMAEAAGPEPAPDTELLPSPVQSELAGAWRAHGWIVPADVPVDVMLDTVEDRAHAQAGGAGLQQQGDGKGENEAPAPIEVFYKHFPHSGPCCSRSAAIHTGFLEFV
jgi:hypothetical protein